MFACLHLTSDMSHNYLWLVKGGRLQTTWHTDDVVLLSLSESNCSIPGKVLSHPYFARPSVYRKDIEFVDIDLAEPALTKQTIADIQAGNTGSQEAVVSI